jgi:CRP-like cAMP-binding protein
MKDNSEKLAPEMKLSYDEGDLVIKEGDYGISIYKILKGRVRITKKSSESEIALATLGPGDIFGEMAFLNKLLEIRSASVRAVEPLELEVWHPARLTREYKQMPPMLQYAIGQSLSRLIRANKMLSQLNRRKGAVKEKERPSAGKQSVRMYNRKPLDCTCIYRPTRASRNVTLGGRIIDMSLGGFAMDVGRKNTSNYPHDYGDEYEVDTTLPNGQALHLVSVLKAVEKSSEPGRMILRMEFGELAAEATKRVGFFMMS